MKKLALSLLALASLGFTASADSLLLQTALLRAGADSAYVQMNTCRGDEFAEFQSIQIHAVSHTAILSSIEVQYANRNSDYIDLRQNLAPGTYLQWINVSERGCVLSIHLVASSGSIGLRDATIEIYGDRVVRDGRDRRRQDGPPMRPPPRDDRGQQRGPHDPNDVNGDIQLIRN